MYVGGEVENPGPVELSSLPVRELAVKALGFAEGKPQFKGAYFFSGYSLYDILKAKPVKKAGVDFRPEVDLFVTVENEKGEKAVFSWGEIYYARNNFNALIYKGARSITTGRGKDWPLPEEPRVVCADDMYNDEAEVVVSTLIDFKEAVKIIKSQSITRLTSTWQTWVRTFYDMGVKERDEETCEITYKKESKGNFSDQFDIIINGEDLDGNGETGEEDVDVPVDSDNDGDTDSYEVKDEFKGLKAWKKEIKEGKKKLKNKINACGDIGYLDDDGACNDYCYGRYGDGSGCTTCYKDVPCILDSGGITTDSDADDEFEEALTAIDGLISNLESFQKSAKNYYNDMDAVYEKMNEKYGADFDFGGINPVTYRWTDSRCMGGKDFEEDAEGNPDMTKICGQDTGDNDGDGDKDEPDPACPRMDTCDQDADGITEELYKCHSITVEVSQFKVPWVDNEESGGFLSKKSCAVLTDYCYKNNDDTSWECEESYNALWVKITRTDLGNQMVGNIANWNPKGDGDDENTCSKTSSG